MIATSPDIASARPVLPRIASAGSRARLAHLLVSLAVLLGLPASAAASGGGVSIGTSATSPATAKKAATSRGSATKARGAQATDDDGDRPRSVNRAQLRRAQTLLRLSPSGTHDAKTRSTVRRFQRLRGLSDTGIIDGATYLEIKNAFALLETGGAAPVAADDGVGGATVGSSAAPPLVLPQNLAPITATERAILDQIGQCESQGDPSAISTDGQYRGKYQFDTSTWRTVGGTGDPAAATEEEQDQRAAILLRQRGTAPWPVCAGSVDA